MPQPRARAYRPPPDLPASLDPARPWVEVEMGAINHWRPHMPGLQLVGTVARQRRRWWWPFGRGRWVVTFFFQRRVEGDLP